MKFIQYSNTKGIPTKEITCVIVDAVPTAATEGAPGLFVMVRGTGAVYKCVGENGDTRIWEPIDGATVIDSGFYYTNLSTAISDINNGVTINALPNASNAYVKVFAAENGRLTVSLLADVEENTLITVSEDIDLVLAGHTLRFTTVGAYLNFAEGTSCTINGEATGSAITKGDANTTYADIARLVYSNGKKLAVCGGRYEITAKCKKSNAPLVAGGNVELTELSDCHVKVSSLSVDDASLNHASRGVQVDGGDLVMRGTKLECVAEVLNCYPVDAYKSGTVTLENCEVYATSAGASVKCFGLSFESTGDVLVTDTVCQITAAGSAGYAVSASNLGKAVFERCELSASTPNSTTECEALYSGNSTVLLVDTLVHTDAPSSAVTNKAYGVGVSGGSVRMVLCDVKAPLYPVVALQAPEEICIDRCSLTGYVAGICAQRLEDTTVLVTDTEIKAGQYSGEYADSVTQIAPVAGFKIGGGSVCNNSVVYVDGCTINTEAGAKAVLVSSANGEYGNTLRISNTTVNGDGTVSIEAVADGQAAHHIDVGIGTNITAEMIDNADLADFTSELYRKKHPDAELNGADLAAVLGFLNVKTAAGVS